MISKAEAAKELLARKRAHATMQGHVSYVAPGTKWAHHHIILADAWDRICKGELKRLIVTLPPRHGKSEMSKRGIAYAMQEYELDVIMSSYNEDMATKYGGAVKDFYLSKRFKTLYEKPENKRTGEEKVEIGLNPDNRSQADWTSLCGQTLKCTGVGGSLTGHGGNILLIDDPVKDAQQAASDNYREATWEWYKRVFATRGNYKDGFGSAAIVIIMTRWHEDDLVGRLLEQEKDNIANGQKPEGWEVIKFQAIMDEGTEDERALWPEHYPLEDLKRFRAQDERVFDALFQQEPAPQRGIHFKRKDLIEYQPDELPEGLNIYGAWDCATGVDKGDYTELGVFGVDEEGCVWLIDGYHGRVSTDVWIEQMLDLVEIYKPRYWFGESGIIHRSTEPFLKKRMEERNVWITVKTVNRGRGQDKLSCLQGAIATSVKGKFRLPDTSYGRRGKEQLLKFPAGRHDDFCDMVSNFFMNLDSVHKPIKKEIVKKTPMDGYKFPKLYDGNMWKTI